MSEDFDSLLLLFRKAGEIFYAGLMPRADFFKKSFASICHNIIPFQINIELRAFAWGTYSLSCV